jgi:hypothetical protein
MAAGDRASVAEIESKGCGELEVGAQGKAPVPILLDMNVQIKESTHI